MCDVPLCLVSTCDVLKYSAAKCLFTSSIRTDTLFTTPKCLGPKQLTEIWTFFTCVRHSTPELSTWVLWLIPNWRKRKDSSWMEAWKDGKLLWFQLLLPVAVQWMCSLFFKEQIDIVQFAFEWKRTETKTSVTFYFFFMLLNKHLYANWASMWCTNEAVSSLSWDRTSHCWHVFPPGHSLTSPFCPSAPFLNHTWWEQLGDEPHILPPTTLILQFFHHNIVSSLSN